MSNSCKHIRWHSLLSFPPPGLLLVPPVLCVGVVPAYGPLRQLLEVVCGSWLTLPVGKDCGHRRLPNGRPLHRGGELATVKGEASGHPAHSGPVDVAFVIRLWTSVIGFLHVNPVANVFFDCQSLGYGTTLYHAKKTKYQNPNCANQLF